jgi:hypothetical protein
VSADLAPYRCDAEEARALTEQIKTSVEKTWRLLLNAHEWNAWGALGYSTWESYVRAEFGIGRSRSYQLLDQARVVREIEAAVSTTVDITERDVRDLKPHLAEVTEAVRDAVADVPEAERPAAAAQAVKNARERFRPQTAPAPVAPQDAGASQTSPPSEPVASVGARPTSTGGGEHEPGVAASEAPVSGQGGHEAGAPDAESEPWQPPPPSPEAEAERARQTSREAWSRNLAHHAHFFARLAIASDTTVRQQVQDFLPAFAGPFEQVTPDVLRDAARYLTALADAWQQERAA